MCSVDRFNLEQQCLNFLEVQGLEVADYPGMDRLDSLILQALSLFAPSALDEEMAQLLAELRAERATASGVTGEWTLLEEDGE